MTKTHAILVGPLILGLLAVAFCVWSALGNDVNICVTTGCTLYEDFSIGGISLWWIGAGAFTLLCACALLGRQPLGRWLAGLFLLGDICLLLLMALTAPCVSCLVIALFFALCYLFFRRQNSTVKNQGSVLRPSVLLWLWLALYMVNLGQVGRSQLDVWPILNESGEDNLRMFFSPSCKYCIEGINVLSGNINVGFYPLAENEADVARIDKMVTLLAQGQSLSEALGQSRDAEFGGIWAAYNPDALLLRFRLLRNKAHVFAQGSQGVPFFERKGLPPDVIARAEKARLPIQNEAPKAAPITSGDSALPEELREGGQCGAGVPCPPGGLTN